VLNLTLSIQTLGKLALGLVAVASTTTLNTPSSTAQPLSSYPYASDRSINTPALAKSDRKTGQFLGKIRLSQTIDNGDSPAAWYWPQGTFGSTKHPTPVNPDYLNLFSTPPSWPSALAHTKVFGMGYNQVLKMSDTDLRNIFAWLATHNIALAVQLEVLKPGTLPSGAPCGQGEGYGSGSTPKTLERIKSLDGTLAYAVLDEPYAFGHLIKQTPGAGGSGPQVKCQYPIETVAQQVADAEKAIKAMFPDALYVDTEPTDAIYLSHDPIGEFGSYLDTYAQYSGHPFPILQLDVQWEKNKWQSELPAIVQALTERGTDYAPIYDDNSNSLPGMTGAQWVERARQRIIDVRALGLPAPHHVVFQSWDSLPDHVLPEDDPSTLLYLLNAYYDKCQN